MAVERGRVASRLATENVDSISKAIAGVTAVLETVAGIRHRGAEAGGGVCCGAEHHGL